MLAHRTLRPYQSRNIALLLGHFASGLTRVALVSPTGSGKSLLVQALLTKLALGGRFTTAVVCVPQTHIKGSFDNATTIDDLDDDLDDDVRRKEGSVTLDVTRTCFVDAGKSTQRFADQLEGLGDCFAYVCTHATLARAEAVDLVRGSGDLSNALLVIDEGHHSTSDQRANRLSQLRDVWLAVGGSVLLVTATPFRTDNTPVLDDTWTVVTRSMAEHSIGGVYAPEFMQCEHRWLAASAKSKRELDDGVKAESRLAKQIASDWSTKDVDRKGNRPKTIVIVPANDSQTWTRMLAVEFKRVGARVFDATGTSKEKQFAVREVLESEGRVARWADSEIDVMLGCKRFDEGTDWPLCSHVYVIGYPVSINTTVQRWGRTTRCKAGIVGHPFRDTASIVFYNPAWSEQLSEDLRKAGKLSLHRETSHLLAAHLNDWETGQEYAKAYAGVNASVRASFKRKQDRDKFDNDVQASALDDRERAATTRDVDFACAKLGYEPADALGREEIGKVIAEVKKQHGDDRASNVGMLIMERSDAPSEVKAKAVRKATATPRIPGQPQSMVRRELRARFCEIVQTMDAKYVDKSAKARLAEVARWNGEQVCELTERMSDIGVWVQMDPPPQRWPLGSTVTSIATRVRARGNTWEADIGGKTSAGQRLRKRVKLDDNVADQTEAEERTKSLADWLVGCSDAVEPSSIRGTVRLRESDGRWEVDLFLYRGNTKRRIRRQSPCNDATSARVWGESLLSATIDRLEKVFRYEDVLSKCKTIDFTGWHGLS